MKKILLIIPLGIFLLGSCSVRKPVSQFGYGVDYTRYADKGFFITELKTVDFQYEPVGSVTGMFSSGYEIKFKDGKPEYTVDYYGKEIPRTTNKYVNATEQGALDELYKKAVEMGADGVINLKYKTDVEVVKGMGAHLTGYEVSGMAIKRK